MVAPRSSGRKRNYVQYEISGCSDCALRDRCYSAKGTRRIVRRIPRLLTGEPKEALREVMKHPQARAAYSKRKAMVEPVFSYLSGVMNVRRFRRRGLEKVRLEFSLYAAAYNLGRVLAAAARGCLPASYALVLLYRLLKQCRSQLGAIVREKPSLARSVALPA